MSVEELKEMNNNIFNHFLRLVDFTTRVNDLFWEDPKIQKLIKEKPKFDLVIMIAFFNEAVLGLGPHFGAPTIIFNCIGAFSIWNSYVANPTMVYSRNPMIGISTDNFWGRLTTVTVNMMMSFMTYSTNIMNQSEYQKSVSIRRNLHLNIPEQLNKHLPNSPSVQELRTNVSLVLANSHFSIEPARPYVPNMIQIGGFHVQESKPLPKEFQTFLDGAKKGAILFSLGSNIKIEMIEEPQRNAIFKVLGAMAPMRVIFKSELQHENIPSNIMVKKWVPQADILGKYLECFS